MGGEKYRMRCIGTSADWDAYRNSLAPPPTGCGWRGIRTDHLQCECYDIWRMYCHPLTPGPGCPRGIAWPCPRCRGSVTGKPVKRRALAHA